MIVSPEKYRNKTILKEAIKKGENVLVEDPSIFNPRVFMIKEMRLGEVITVTNHPKRSYFVKIQRKVDGTFKVE